MNSHTHLATFKSIHSNNLEIQLFGKPDNPYFIGKQITHILGFSNTAVTLDKFVKKKDKKLFKSLCITGYSSNCSPNTVLINENGVMSLIDNSKLHKSRDFRKWIVNEVIPDAKTQGNDIEDGCDTTVSEPQSMHQHQENTELVMFDLQLRDKKIRVPVRKDGYVNVTLICNAVGKDINKWKENKSSQELIQVFSKLTGIPVVSILESISGRHTGGTFAHPDLAIQIAQTIKLTVSLAHIEYSSLKDPITHKYGIPNTR